MEKITNQNGEQHDVAKYLEVYSRLSKDRIIFLSEDITKDVGSSISSLFLFYDHESNVDPVKLYINSNGGDATALANMYDVMQMISAPVHTYCVGKAYSAAAVLLAAGAKGHRYAYRHCDVMIHGLQAQFPLNDFSDKTDTEIDFKMLETYNQHLMKILSRHVKADVAKLYKDCARDFYLSAEEAVQYGIVDHVL